VTAAVTPQPSTEAQTGVVPVPRDHTENAVPVLATVVPAADPGRLLSHQHSGRCWWDVSGAGWVCG
jgi:hypothetical protein